MGDSQSATVRKDERREAAVFVMVQTVVALAVTFALAAWAVILPSPVARPLAMSGAAAAWSFLAAFAAATAVLLILLRTFRGSRVFEAVFLIAVFTGIGSLCAAVFGSGPAVLLTAVAVFLYYGSRSVLAFDVLLVLGAAGIAANLGGAMSPVGAAVILAILAVYDLVAVYVTKHMVTMAETLLRRRVFFAMIFPERPSDLLLPVTEAEPGRGFVFLGTGDIVLPALLVASAARISPIAALVTGAGALIGAVSLHVLFLSQRMRKPMPALPPLAAGALLGLVISFFL